MGPFTILFSSISLFASALGTRSFSGTSYTSTYLTNHGRPYLLHIGSVSGTPTGEFYNLGVNCPDVEYNTTQYVFLVSCSYENQTFKTTFSTGALLTNIALQFTINVNNNYLVSYMWDYSYSQGLAPTFEYTFTGTISNLVVYSDCYLLNSTELGVNENSTYYYHAGYEDGYDSGVQDGYITGEQVGTETGYENGYNVGHGSGYTEGYNAALSTHDFTFTNLFGSLADTPILIIRRLFGFELFGVSLIAVFMSLFTALIVIHLIKKVF